MSSSGSHRRRSKARKTRRDGWAPERQLRFLAVLLDKRSVREAAAAAGMSRESAYRMRGRPGAELFAALWDTAVRQSAGTPEAHTGELTDGRLARLLGNHFRRQTAGFGGLPLPISE